jgi:hypothetical protein
MGPKGALEFTRLPPEHKILLSYMQSLACAFGSNVRHILSLFPRPSLSVCLSVALSLPLCLSLSLSVCVSHSVSLSRSSVSLSLSLSHFVSPSLCLSVSSCAGARAPKGGVTRQGVVRTDLQSLLDCQYNKTLSLSLSLARARALSLTHSLSGRSLYSSWNGSASLYGISSSALYTPTNTCRKRQGGKGFVEGELRE